SLIDRPSTPAAWPPFSNPALTIDNGPLRSYFCRYSTSPIATMKGSPLGACAIESTSYIAYRFVASALSKAAMTGAQSACAVPANAASSAAEAASVRTGFMVVSFLGCRSHRYSQAPQFDTPVERAPFDRVVAFLG